MLTMTRRRRTALAGLTLAVVAACPARAQAQARDPLPPTDPLLPAGIVASALGVASIAGGAITMAEGRCAPDARECASTPASVGAGLLGAGVASLVLGVAAISTGIEDVPPSGSDRRSEKRMIVGVALASAGLSAAVGGAAAAIVDRASRHPEGETLAVSLYLVLGGVAGSITGFALWGSGGRAVDPEETEREQRERLRPERESLLPPKRIGPGMRNTGIGLSLGGSALLAVGGGLLAAEDLGRWESAKLGPILMVVGGLTLATGIPLLAVGQARYRRLQSAYAPPTVVIGIGSAALRGSF